ncbi:MAG: AmmeMemoRadiSam system protein B [Elusimicrobia bacterium]|nr:AmmeMemoRadiSam system protein B [Elusimicrobiota bacterium]
MEDPKPIPRLRRDVAMVPAELKGKPAFILQDQEGIAKEIVALSPAGMALAALFDGRSTAEEIRAVLAKRMRVDLTAAQIREIADQLEKANFLETALVQSERKRGLEEFFSSPIRKAVLKGAYPENKLELAAYFGKLLRDPKGPGKGIAEAPTLQAPPAGLIAPHIDIERGGPAYAWSYQALSESPPPDLVVALGVAHASPKSPWVMTRKDYETPYGPIPTSQELYEDIRNQLWYDPAEEEWVHRNEHSLEYQALWLKFLWREKTPPWVPILVSSFERFCPDKPPSSAGSVEEALRNIGELLARRAKERKILILAAVDLAHVGPKFGDDLELDVELKKKLEAEDRATLERAMALDADGFYLSGIAEGGWRKLCGLSALYTSLRWLKALGAKGPGELLRYGQASDPMGGIVSFASAVFR